MASVRDRTVQSIDPMTRRRMTRTLDSPEMARWFRTDREKEAALLRGRFIDGGDLEHGKLSRASGKRADVALDERGMRRDEGMEWELAGPQVLSKAMALVEGKLSRPELANELAISESLLDDVLGTPRTLDANQSTQ